MAPPRVKKAPPPSSYVQSDMAQRIKDALAKVENFMGLGNRQRLERAADEGVNLGVYTPRALEKAVSEASNHLLTVMDPAQFQDFAARLPDRALNQVPYEIAKDFPQKLRTGHHTLEDVLSYYGDVGRESGWHDVPELRIDIGTKRPLLFTDTGALMPTNEEYPFVRSHEGRHRSMALADYLKEPKSLVVVRPQFAGRHGDLQWNGDTDAERTAYFLKRLQDQRIVPEEQAYIPLTDRNLTEEKLPKFGPLFAEGGEVEAYGSGGQKGALRRLATRFEKGILDWYGDTSRKAGDQVMFESRSTGKEAGRFGTEDWLSPKLMAHPSSVEMDKLYVPDPNVAYGHTQRPADRSGYNTFRVEVDEGSKPGFQIHTHPPLTVEGKSMPIGDRLTEWNTGGVGPIAPSRGDLENWLYGYGFYPERAPNLTSYIHGGQGDQVMALGTPDFAKSPTSMSMADMLDKALRAKDQFNTEAWDVANHPDVRAISYAYGVTNPSPMWGLLNNEVLARHGVPVTIDKNARYGKGFAEDALNDVVTKLFQRGEFAEGGEVQHFDKGSLVKRAKGALSGFADKATKYIDEWKWNPLEDVAEKMPVDIPQHVLDYGDFMRHMTNVAGTDGLTPRDLIKAFTTTRASIQRQARSRDKLDPSIPLTETGQMIRPEGAFADWLQSPMGEKYLKYASEGEAHPETIADAMRFMRTFGLHNKLGDDLTLAPTIMPGREGQLSKLIADSGAGVDNVSDWFAAVKDIPGIDAAKRGFLGAMLGYGRLPTLDARQLEMNVPMDTRGMLSKFGRRGSGRGGEEAVERLSDRIRALDFGMPEEYRPFDMHLGHHTMWDAAKGDVTTHDDLKRMMLNRAEGGPVQHFQTGSKVKKPRGALSFRPVEEAAKYTGELIDDVLGAITRRGKSTVDKIADTVPVSPYDRFTTTKLATDPVLNVPTIRPEEIEGSRVILTPGDRTQLGYQVLDVDGMPLINPRELEGGPLYAFGPASKGRQIWASMPPVISGLYNEALRANLEGKDAYLMPWLMGRQASDSARMQMDIMHDLIKSRQFGPNAVETLDNLLLKANLPGLPSIGDTDAFRKFSNDLKLEKQWKLAQTLGSRGARDAGMPDMAHIRLSTVEPRFLSSDYGTTGFSVSKIDPTQPPIRRDSAVVPHSGYEGKLLGDALGGFERPVPYSVIYPENWQRFLDTGSNWALTRGVHGFDMTPERVDRVSKWIEDANAKGLPRKARGGLMTEDDMSPPFFDYQTPEIGSEGMGALSSNVKPLNIAQGPSPAMLAQTNAVDADTDRLMASAPKAPQMRPMQQQKDGGGDAAMKGIGEIAKLAMMFLNEGGSVPGYASGGQRGALRFGTGNMFLDSSENDSDYRRMTMTPAERRALRLARIRDKQDAADAELYLSDPVKFSESREPGYRWDEAKQFARGLADLPGYIVGGAGDLHDLANEYLPERLQMERFLPNSSEVNEYVDRVTGYEPRYTTTGGARDVAGLLATAGGSMPAKAPGILNLLKRLGSAGFIGMQALPMFRGEEPYEPGPDYVPSRLDPKAAYRPDPTTGMSPDWITHHADRVGYRDYAEGGEVDGYQYAHESDWNGEPGVSMYKEGGVAKQLLGTAGKALGHLIPIPIIGPAIGQFAGDTIGNLIEGSTDEIGDDALTDFTMGYGDPDRLGFERGGEVGQPDVIEYASNYNHGMVPDSYADGAPRFNVNGALRALGDLVYAGEPGQKNIGNYYISRSDPQVATGEMPQEGYVKTYPQQRSFRPMPDEVDPRYHSRDKSMARSDMLYNFASGGRVDDDALLYHAIDTQNFRTGGALRYCGGGYAR